MFLQYNYLSPTHSLNCFVLPIILNYLGWKSFHPYNGNSGIWLKHMIIKYTIPYYGMARQVRMMSQRWHLAKETYFLLQSDVLCLLGSSNLVQLQSKETLPGWFSTSRATKQLSVSVHLSEPWKLSYIVLFFCIIFEQFGNTPWRRFPGENKVLPGSICHINQSDKSIYRHMVWGGEDRNSPGKNFSGEHIFQLTLRSKIKLTFVYNFIHTKIPLMVRKQFPAEKKFLFEFLANILFGCFI